MSSLYADDRLDEIKQQVPEKEVLIFKLRGRNEFKGMGGSHTQKCHKYLIFFNCIDFFSNEGAQSYELFEDLSEKSTASEGIMKKNKDNLKFKDREYRGGLVAEIDNDRGKSLHPRNLRDCVQKRFNLGDSETKIVEVEEDKSFKEMKNWLKNQD